MREAMKDRALRNIFVMGMALAIAASVCVANIFFGNVYCIVASLALVLLLAFSLGYAFGRYESAEKAVREGKRTCECGNAPKAKTVVEENEEDKLL